MLAALLLAACSPVIAGQGSKRAGASPGLGTTAPSSGAPSPATPTIQPITFVDCTNLLSLGSLPFPAGRRAKLTFFCGRLQVPLDYADPTGKKITLEIIKVHDSDNTASTGSLLVNPGGPGGSGLDLVAGLSAQVSDSLLTHFDLVGFDPRGVGLSAPIECTTNAQKDALNSSSPQILTATGFALAKQQAQSVAASCLSKYGATLADYNTVNTARDMDLIRQAVGDQQMNYLGFSYGTELGAQYAHLFPGRIRAFVLDGAVDPLTGPITSFADQLKGFEGAFDQFAANCLTLPACSPLGNPRQVVYGIVRKAFQSPLPTGTSRRLTENLALTGVLDALYSQSQWPKLAQALSSGQNGDGSGLLALADDYNQRYADGTYSNIADANLTISCNDSAPGPTDATVRATAVAWAKEYPMFGLWAAPSLLSCQSWQPVRTVPPLPTAPTPATVLVIGNLHDPATPYQGAIDLTKTLGHARLLTWNGEGHTSYLQGSSCIDNDVNNYLISAALPAPNTTCPR